MSEYTSMQKAAADEIDRRAMPKATRPKFVKTWTVTDLVFNMSKDELKVTAGPLAEKVQEQVAKPKPKASKTVKAEATTPKAVKSTKGVSRLGLTPKQVKDRDALYASGLRGQAYQDACTAKKIPTTKNGLVNA